MMWKTRSFKPKIHNLPAKVSTVSLFTNLVTATEATDLYKPVTLLELKNILFLLKKERSPRARWLDGRIFHLLF
jgi:hypothetical protein